MSKNTISTYELRRRISKLYGLVPMKKPEFFLPPPIPYDESLCEFKKTDLMNYIEAKYAILIKTDIYKGSINDVCSRYNWEVDRATISRWRKYVRRFLINHPEKKEIRK